MHRVALGKRYPKDSEQKGGRGFASARPTILSTKRGVAVMPESGFMPWVIPGWCLGFVHSTGLVIAVAAAAAASRAKWTQGRRIKMYHTQK